MIVPLRQELIPAVIDVLGLGAPYIRPRTPSDYWMYSRLFASSCPVCLVDDNVVGAVMAFRSQEDPHEVYIQDVMTHPEHRRQGIARAMMQAVSDRARAWGCKRLYLTSEPDNAAANSSWINLGFSNVLGDHNIDGVWVTKDFKGPGKDRAIYELLLE